MHFSAHNISSTSSRFSFMLPHSQLYYGTTKVCQLASYIWGQIQYVLQLVRLGTPTVCQLGSYITGRQNDVSQLVRLRDNYSILASQLHQQTTTVCQLASYIRRQLQYVCWLVTLGDNYSMNISVELLHADISKSELVSR